MNLNPIWDNFFTKKADSSSIDFLKSISLFEDLKSSEVVRLERTLHTREYKKDEIVFNEGEPGAALYIVEDGKVEIYINYETEPILLATLEKGMFFGEIALFDETPRSATVVAAKDSVLIALSKPDFKLFSKKEPEIGNKIVMRLGKILSKRLIVANHQIEELKSVHV